MKTSAPATLRRLLSFALPGRNSLGLLQVARDAKRGDLVEKLDWLFERYLRAAGWPESLRTAYREPNGVGGYLRGYPGGSIWEIEGLLLYALARVGRPDVAIETGTFQGCSSRHIELALKRNQRGRLYSIDLAPSASSGRGSEHVVPVRAEAVHWLESNPDIVRSCTFFFHDSDHSPEHVTAEIQAVWALLPPGAIVVCHDVLSPAHNPPEGGTWEAFRQAVGAEPLRLDFHPFSNCGLGLARKVS